MDRENDMFLHRLAPWLIALVAFCTFFPNNGLLAPDIMESRNIITAREMVEEGHWVVPTMNGQLRLEKPPLPTWLTALAQIGFPASVRAQRTVAGLMGCLLAIFFYLFARDILRTRPAIPTLILLTCYSLALMGRTASWDIYTHAFMMGGIYFLARALTRQGRRWRAFLWAGLFTGLSILSKGPVALFALLLPFIFAFCFYYHPSSRGKGGGIAAMVAVALAVGCWWYALMYLGHPDDMARAAAQESDAWTSHNVRPWYYYWKFFLETGIWSLMLITAIFAVFIPACRRSRDYLFSLAWLMLTLLLLSCMPEKKPRYLLPMLIPASCLMGVTLNLWKQTRFRHQDAARVLFRTNAWVIAVALVLASVAAWYFLVQPGHMTLGLWIGASTVLIAGAFLVVVSAVRLSVAGLVWSVAATLSLLLCFFLPSVRPLVTNTEMNSIGHVSELQALKEVPLYYNGADPLRIEMVCAAGRTIRPLDCSSADSVLSRAPLAVITHRHAGDELPRDLWQRADSTYIGRYDDNHHPKTSRHYTPSLLYHLTLVTPRQSRP